MTTTLPIAVGTKGNSGLVLGLAFHEDTVVAVGGQGRDLILVSEDGGKSFKAITGKGKGLRQAWVDQTGLYVVGEWGYVAHAKKIGGPWKEIKSASKACLFGCVPDDEGRIWIGGDGGFLGFVKGDALSKVKGVGESIARMWKSPFGVLIPCDGGTLYRTVGKKVEKTAAAGKSDLMAAIVTPKGTIIAVGGKGTLLRSTDEGASFEEIDAPAVLLCGVDCFEDGRVIVVGASGTILVSEDDGKSFERVAHNTGTGTFWCCRRITSGDIVVGGENGLVFTIAKEMPAAEEEAAPAKPVEPAPIQNEVYITPELKKMLYPRRGGLPLAIRPLPTVEAAWADLRKFFWAADRTGMNAKDRPSGIWEAAASFNEATRLMGERFLEAKPRVGTVEEDVRMVEQTFARYSTFLAGFHEEIHTALTDFLVAQLGLNEAIARLFAGMDDELPYVGVGPFGRLRELLVLASPAEFDAARTVIHETLALECGRKGDEDRVADLTWAATFLLPLGPEANDRDKKLHEDALQNCGQFGNFRVHACGLGAGDVASLELYRTKNGKTRHEFFAPFDGAGHMFLASVLELEGGAKAGPVLAKMKPGDPWENDSAKNTLWTQVMAHARCDDALEAMYKEHKKAQHWGTEGLEMAARFEKDRAVAFAKSKEDDKLVAKLEKVGAMPIVPPAAADVGELGDAVDYVPPKAARPPTVAASKLEPEETWTAEEREATNERSITESDRATWNGKALRALSPEELETFIAHCEKFKIPTSVEIMALAPRSIQPRLHALGYELGEYWMRWGLPGLMARSGLDMLPMLAAAVSDGSVWETALPAALPFGDVSLVPAMAKAFAGKKHKAVARAWILRHPRHAIAGALSMWNESKSQEALRILRYLDGRGHRDAILEQGDVLALLNEDPLAAPKAKKPKLPKYADAEALPKLVRNDKKKVDSEKVEELLVQLAFSNADEVHPGVTEAKSLYTTKSRAEFAWALFEAWLAKKAPPDDAWCMQSIGFFGDDESARKLTTLAKAWPGENASARAQAALDALLNIGTDTALMNINLLAEKSRFPAFKAAAKERIDAIAYARGLTSDELADRLVPTLGLEEENATEIDLGPRKLTIVFGEDLLPKLRDEAGKVHNDIPKAKADDKDLAKEAKTRLSALKKDARASASLQIARMERTMRTGRLISDEVFDACFAKHPWMSHLARRFVWGAIVDGKLASTFRVTEDGTLANIEEDTFKLPKGASVSLLHPLQIPKTELTRWGQIFSDYEILTPFPQLDRPVFEISDAEKKSRTLTRFDKRSVEFTQLRGLEARGWEKWYDASVQMARRFTGGWAVLDTYPGWHPSQTADDIETQRIDGLHLSGKLESFGDLSPLAFSELIYDLERVTTPAS